MARKRTKPPKKTTGKPGKRVDYKGARAWYDADESRTLEDAAHHVGASPGTIRRRAADEHWADERARSHNKLRQRGLELALEDQAEAALEITRIERTESLDCARHLEGLRAKGMDGWTPKKVRDHIAAVRECTSLARLSAGLPTQIVAKPGEAQESYDDLIARREAERDDDEGDRGPEAI